MKIILNGEEAEIGSGGISEEQAKEIAAEAAAGKLDITGGELTGDLSLADGKRITLKRINGNVYPHKEVLMGIQPSGEIVTSTDGDISNSITTPGIFSFSRGAQFEGDVSLAGNHLYAVAAPAQDSDGANKKYVDEAVSKAAKMASGSYTGNGDPMNPTVVEIGFRPKFFVCTEKRQPFVSFPVETGEQVPYNHLTWFDGMDVYTICLNGISRTFPIAAAETGISFGMMAASRASMAGWAIAQLNADGVEYGWFAVG